MLNVHRIVLVSQDRHLVIVHVQIVSQSGYAHASEMFRFLLVYQQFSPYFFAFRLQSCVPLNHPLQLGIV